MYTVNYFQHIWFSVYFCPVVFLTIRFAIPVFAWAFFFFPPPPHTFFYVQPVMNDTMESRFPFHHDRNPASKPRTNFDVAGLILLGGLVRSLIEKCEDKSKRVASKHDRSRLAVSSPQCWTAGEAREVTSEFGPFWGNRILKFFSFKTADVFSVSWQLIPSQTTWFPLGCTQCACLVALFANSMSATWELSLLWKATGGVVLTEAAELGFKWPLELHHTQPLCHSSLRGYRSAPRQVHVCLFSTCHDIAGLQTPPHHPLPQSTPP